MLCISHTGCQWRYLPEELAPGPGSGPSFAGGRGTKRGRGFSPRCTPRRVRLWAERIRGPRWWSSTPSSHEEPRTAALLLTARAVPTTRPTAPSASSTWTTRGSLCVRVVPPRRPRPAPSNGYARTSRRRCGCEVRRVGWDEPPRNENGAKVFRPIRHARGWKWPTGISCDAVARRAASRTPWLPLLTGSTSPLSRGPSGSVLNLSVLGHRNG